MASNANLVFKAVNTGGRDGSIIELTDKPMVIMGSDQDQLFCCWTIVPVAGDHIIAGTSTPADFFTDPNYKGYLDTCN